MSVQICSWCGVTLNINRAMKGHKNGVPIFLHVGCNNTITLINQLEKRIAKIEGRLPEAGVAGEVQG